MPNQIAPIANAEGDTSYRMWSAEVDLTKRNNGFTVDLRGYSDVSIQVTILRGSWGTGDITVERSNDDDNYYALATPKTFSADGLHDLDDFKQPFLAVRTNTIDAAAGIVSVTIYARKD